MDKAPGTEAAPPLLTRPTMPATTPPPTKTDTAVEEATSEFVSYQEETKHPCRQKHHKDICSWLQTFFIFSDRYMRPAVVYYFQTT